uniref:Phospholipase B-like n=1 Tax=Steinernema glaseri TaxID=37863 RepID=A0A1I7YNH9_9BILA
MYAPMSMPWFHNLYVTDRPFYNLVRNLLHPTEELRWTAQQGISFLHNMQTQRLQQPTYVVPASHQVVSYPQYYVYSGK